MSGSDKYKATFYTIIYELDNNNNNKINGKIIMPQTTLQFNGKMGKRKCPRTTNWPIHDQPNNRPTEHHQFLYASLSMVITTTKKNKLLSIRDCAIKVQFIPPALEESKWPSHYFSLFVLPNIQMHFCMATSQCTLLDRWVTGWLAEEGKLGYWATYYY